VRVDPAKPKHPTAFAFQAGAVSGHSGQDFRLVPKRARKLIFHLRSGLDDGVLQAGSARWMPPRRSLALRTRLLQVGDTPARQCPLKQTFSAVLEPDHGEDYPWICRRVGDHAGWRVDPQDRSETRSPNQPLRWSMPIPRRDTRFMFREELEDHQEIGICGRLSVSTCWKAGRIIESVHGRVDRNKLRRACFKTSGIDVVLTWIWPLSAPLNR